MYNGLPCFYIFNVVCDFEMYLAASESLYFKYMAILLLLAGRGCPLYWLWTSLYSQQPPPLDFDFEDNTCDIIVKCTVKTTGPTGVEMEALTGVNVALLTIYDMCKSMDRAMEISGIHLLEKSGGKSGDYHA